MAYQVQILKSARKQFESLDARVQRRVDAAILKLADTPRSPPR